MNNENENPHRAHRSRIKTRFCRHGLDNFSTHEVLEMVLFYAIPQKDTNELAHRLINTFGSVHGVFSADIHDLMAVDGIGEHAAVLIKMWLPVASRILTEAKVAGVKDYGNVDAVGDYFVRRYIGETREVVYLMMLDNRYSLIDCVRVHEGSVNSVSVSPRRIIELAYRADAPIVVLAHNHPSGFAVPSGEDISTTLMLCRALENIGITLLEHILVAGQEYAPVLLKSEKPMLSPVDRRAFYAGSAFEEGWDQN